MVAGAGVAAADSADPGYTVIASGLNNPRHLSFGSDGALYVAESGVGGDGPCITSSDGSFVCYGPTGSIGKVTHGRHGWTEREVVTGLPSLAPPADIPPANPGDSPVVKGGSATGPSDVIATRGRYVASIGLGAPPTDRGRGQATDQTQSESRTLPRGFGDLITGSTRPNLFCRFFPHARPCATTSWRTVADIAAYEQRNNPVDTPDSNPASVQRDGSKLLVADAGGNTVLSVNRGGHVSLIAAFSDEPVVNPPAFCKLAGCPPVMQAVPTSVVRGPGGSYYVSQLTGFPFPQGGSSIWKVTPAHGHHAAVVTKYATGLTNVTDLAFARDGSLYAVEISSTGLASSQGPASGALVRIPRGGGSATTVAGPLFAPYGVALSGRYAYVTTGSVLPGTAPSPLGGTGGQVIQIPLDH